MMGVGLFAASIANATGTGGGVVFVPAFVLLASLGGPDLSPQEVVAISLLIQSFGMTAGALSWSWRLTGPSPLALGVPTERLLTILGLALGAGVPSLWATQGFVEVSGPALLVLFKSFSLVLGLVLLWSLRRPEGSAAWRRGDGAAVLAIGVLGGVATALFSVGLGELLAIYLFLRGFSLALSVSSAVMATSVLVIAGAPMALPVAAPHLAVVAAAVPGVLIGG